MRFTGKQVRLDLPKKWMKFATKGDPRLTQKVRFIGKQVRLDLPKKWMKFATAFSSPPSAIEKHKNFFIWKL
jgi:hypothetical protein